MANRDEFESSGGRLDQSFDQSGQLTAEFESELARLRQSMLMTSREVTTLSSGLESGLRRAFEGVAFDGLKLSDAMRGIARTMADTAFSVAMKPLQQALSGTVTNGLNNLLSGATPFAHGGAFAQGRITAFAKGGVVSQPMNFPMRNGVGLMGEAGPEAIMPLTRGADGRLGVASAGGSRPVNITMNVTTPDVAGFQRSQSQIASQMSRAISRGDRNN